MTRTAGPLLVALAAAVGCGRKPADPPPATTITPPPAPAWSGPARPVLEWEYSGPGFGTRSGREPFTPAATVDLRPPEFLAMFRWVRNETRGVEYARAYRDVLTRLRDPAPLGPTDQKRINDLWELRYVERVDGLRTPDDGLVAYLPFRVAQLATVRPADKAAPPLTLQPLRARWLEQPLEPPEWVLAGEGLARLGLITPKQFADARAAAARQYERGDEWPVERTYWLLTGLMVYRSALEDRLLARVGSGAWPPPPLAELAALETRFKVDGMQGRAVTRAVFAEVEAARAAQSAAEADWELGWRVVGPAGEDLAGGWKRVRATWDQVVGTEPLARLRWAPGPTPAAYQWAD